MSVSVMELLGFGHMMLRSIPPPEEDSELRRDFPQYVRALAEVYGVLNEATSDIDPTSLYRQNSNTDFCTPPYGNIYASIRNRCYTMKRRCLYALFKTNKVCATCAYWMEAEIW